jgi:hypothetical protein
VSYAVENALFQWEEGERRLRESGDRGLERMTAAVLDELRKRLGSEFSVQELSDLYGSEPDWGSPAVPAWIVDAAFAWYARQASDFGGGRARR